MTGLYVLKFFTVTAKLIVALKPKDDVFGAHSIIVKMWLRKSFYLKTFSSFEKKTCLHALSHPSDWFKLIYPLN